jgi:hypothetical protein
MSKVGTAKYELNLKELFGEVPEDRALREKIEQRAIDMIRDRTQKEGTDKNGRGFHPYSDAYKKSLEFEAGGKTGDVNMTLYGDMLNLMDVTHRGSEVSSIGWDDPTQNAKAWNHTTGDTVPKRDFLGLTDKQKAQLSDEFTSDVKTSNRGADNQDQGQTARDNEALRLIDLLHSQFFTSRESDNGD